jgi:hypothetical protein
MNGSLLSMFSLAVEASACQASEKVRKLKKLAPSMLMPRGTPPAMPVAVREPSGPTM